MAAGCSKDRNYDSEESRELKDTPSVVGGRNR